MPPWRALVRASVAVLLSASATVAAGAQRSSGDSLRLTAAERSALDELAPSYAEEFGLHRGWYDGRPVQYFDFGPSPVRTASVIMPVESVAPDGRVTRIPGQRPIFTALPAVGNYSGYWRVRWLVVGKDVPANKVRDARIAQALVQARRASYRGSDIVQNMPIVSRGSFLTGDPAQRPLETGWYKGAEVPYFDFGPTLLRPATLYAFITGKQPDGAPVFLREQANVVAAVPDTSGVPLDLWDIRFVHARADYTPDGWRSVREVVDSARAKRYRIERSGSVRNCPVVLVDGVAVRRGGSLSLVF